MNKVTRYDGLRRMLGALALLLFSSCTMAQGRFILLGGSAPTPTEEPPVEGATHEVETFADALALTGYSVGDTVHAQGQHEAGDGAGGYVELGSLPTTWTARAQISPYHNSATQSQGFCVGASDASPDAGVCISTGGGPNALQLGTTWYASDLGTQEISPAIESSVTTNHRFEITYDGTTVTGTIYADDDPSTVIATVTAAAPALDGNGLFVAMYGNSARMYDFTIIEGVE